MAAAGLETAKASAAMAMTQLSSLNFICAELFWGNTYDISAFGGEDKGFWTPYLRGSTPYPRPKFFLHTLPPFFPYFFFFFFRYPPPKIPIFCSRPSDPRPFFVKSPPTPGPPSPPPHNFSALWWHRYLKFCGHFYEHGLTLISAWISNHMPGKVWVKLLIHS